MLVCRRLGISITALRQRLAGMALRRRMIAAPRRRMVTKWKLIDRVLTIPGPQAMHWSRQLAQKEGIFVGTSAGGTFSAALEIARDAQKGATLLCMLPDTGERYLSTPLFGDILAEMNDEEIALAGGK